MKFLSLVIASLVLISCSSINVKQDYNANYDFSKLRSFEATHGKQTMLERPIP